jgi:hypothetical protein
MTANLEMLRQAAIDCARGLEKTGRRIEIKSDKLKNPVKSEAAGHDVYDEVDMCFIHIIGDGRDIRAHQIKHLSNDQRREFAPIINFYMAAKEGVPVQGYPLDMVAWLSPAQVATYRAAGVLTLENLAGLHDGQIGHFGMGAREHVKKATGMLAGMKEGADAARFVDLEKRLMEQMDSLRRENAELKRTLDALQDAKMAALEVPEILRRTA